MQNRVSVYIVDKQLYTLGSVDIMGKQLYRHRGAWCHCGQTSKQTLGSVDIMDKQLYRHRSVDIVDKQLYRHWGVLTLWTKNYTGIRECGDIMDKQLHRHWVRLMILVDGQIVLRTIHRKSDYSMMM